MPWPSTHHVENVIAGLVDGVYEEASYQGVRTKDEIGKLADERITEWAGYYGKDPDGPSWISPEDEIPYVLRNREWIIEQVHERIEAEQMEEVK